MIYTTFQEVSRYKGLCPALDTAIVYLAAADLSQLAQGRNEVDGEEVFINRFDYTTIPAEQAAWEGHLHYADIHVVLDGEERIGVTDARHLKETARDEAADFVGFEGPVDTWVTMRPGSLLIVFPEDAHLVKVQLSGPAAVKKAVFKVRTDA